MLSEIRAGEVVPEDDVDSLIRDSITHGFYEGALSLCVAYHNTLSSEKNSAPRSAKINSSRHYRLL